MPLTAKINNSRVTTLDDKFESYRELDIRCNCCDSPMIVVNGESTVKHFRHKFKTDCVTAGESVNHLNMKQMLYDIMKRHGKEVELEVQIGRQRVDILIDRFYAVEIQTSPCTFEYIAIKNDAYERAGYHPVWIFYLDRPVVTPVRLNSVLKKIFIRNYNDPHGLDPWAFCYFSKKKEFIIPQFERIKEDCPSSPAGYINKYKIDDVSKWINPEDFIQFLDFYIRDAQGPIQQNLF